MKCAIVLTALLVAGCTPQAEAAPLKLTGNASTQWYDMRPAERGWVGGMLLSAAMGPYGRPDDVSIVEMQAAIAPGTQLVGVCGLLRRHDEVGLFSVVYDPVDLMTDGHAVYRLQNNIMSGQNVETTTASFSKLDEATIIKDCQILGIAGE